MVSEIALVRLHHYSFILCETPTEREETPSEYPHGSKEPRTWKPQDSLVSVLQGGEKSEAGQ